MQAGSIGAWTFSLPFFRIGRGRMPRSSVGASTVSLETRYRAYSAESADGSTAEINARFDGQQALPTTFNEVILATTPTV
jgi:hypothetical protein